VTLKIASSGAAPALVERRGSRQVVYEVAAGRTDAEFELVDSGRSELPAPGRAIPPSMGSTRNRHTGVAERSPR